MGEEIARMTGGSQLTGQSVVMAPGGSASMVMPQQSVAGQSFAMPDMFSTPGLTNVYQATGQMPEPIASTAMPAASAVVEPTASTASVEPTASKKDKKSSKKSSKKKLSSKKKEKGCC